MVASPSSCKCSWCHNVRVHNGSSLCNTDGSAIPFQRWHGLWGLAYAVWDATIWNVSRNGPMPVGRPFPTCNERPNGWRSTRLGLRRQAAATASMETVIVQEIHPPAATAAATAVTIAFVVSSVVCEVCLMAEYVFLAITRSANLRHVSYKCSDQSIQ